MRFMSDSSMLSKGFTLVEVLVIAPIVILVIGGFVGLIIVMTGDVLVTSENTKLIYNTQASVDVVEQDIKQAIEFRDTSYTPSAAPQGLNNTGSPFVKISSGVNGAQNTSFILRVPATDKSPVDPTHQIIYQANAPRSCADPDVAKNTPYTVDLVYYYTYDTFPTSMTLWRRTVVDGSSTPCGTPWQQGSCYPGQSGAVCKVEDTKILTNISTITRQYYATAAAGSVINTGDPSSAYSTGGANATSLYVALQTSRQVAGKTVSQNFNLRPTRHINESVDQVAASTAPTKTPCIFQNNWGNYGGSYGTASYFKTSAGVVSLSGLVAGGNGVSGEVICVLPPGYRPPYRLLFNPYTCGQGNTRVDIAQNGEIRYIAGSTGCVSLSGINFLASGATWTNIYPGVNSWTNYGADHAPAQVSQDSSGRVFLQALAAGGVTTAGTAMFNLPAAIAATDSYTMYPSHTNGVNGSYQILNNKIVYIRSGYNGYFSMQSMFYPSTAGTWTNASLVSGWGNYGSGWAPASYIKNVDGIVSLRGLISGGTTSPNYSTPLFTLPAGYRPSQRIICQTVTSPDVGARIDVAADGQVFFESANSGWLSLSGCDFVAEQ